MCSKKTRVVIEDTHRVVIFILSLVGIFLDSNTALTLALCLWLWSPYWVKLETLCYDKTKGEGQ